MIRFGDILLSFFGLLIVLPLLMILFILGLLDTGSPIFSQIRLGQKKKPFKLYKFRTMKISTESVATHLVASESVTKLGQFLRKTKLDELPQLINVLKGDMSLVGPRPCLLNQDDLIQERDMRGVFNVRPGITGLAQVNQIDMSTPKLLAEYDKNMISSLTLVSYFKYILMTLIGKGSGDRVVND